MEPIKLTGRDLTIEQVVQIARHGNAVAQLDEEIKARLQESRDWVEAQVQHGETPIYGVNTGVGALASKRVQPQQTRRLSRNLILSCVSGVGSPLPVEVVRAMMAIRANMFAQGHSGVRPVLMQRLVDMLNAGVTPLVPSKGSVGASGDLAPLAHIATVLTRDPDDDRGDYSGEAWYEGQCLNGAEAMARAGIERLIPSAKEGAALTNGTDFMVAVGTLAVHDVENLLHHAQVAAALSLEALLGLSDAFHPALHAVSDQPGQQRIAANVRELIEGSELLNSAPNRVQDAYSLRCIPQVLGPVCDVVAYLRGRFAAALNSVTDNPIIFLNLPNAPSGRAIGGGNFHGQGPAIWLDCLRVAIAGVGGIAERRVFRLLTAELSAGLPALLAPSAGLDSGLMMAQYTAAALVSENKTLGHPSSVDSIPTSANQEDYVSMGANAANHARTVIDNLCKIIAIELLTAAQAIDLRENGSARLGRGTAVAYRAVRDRVAFLEHDRELTPDIKALEELIWSGEMWRSVQTTLRP